MSTFTILSVDPETRRWGDKNDMIAYRVHLSGEQGRTVGEKGAELSRHEKAAPPRPDEVVEGELKEFPPHGWKLVKPKGARPAFNGGGGSGGGFQRDPKDTAQIVRQHSQTTAVYWLAVLQKAGNLPDPSEAILKATIDWFDRDVQNNAGTA